MSNVAGRGRDQLGTKISAGLDWYLGRMPLLFSTRGERHAIQQKSGNVVSELVVSGYCYLFLVLNYIGFVVLNMHMDGVYTIQSHTCKACLPDPFHQPWIQP